MVKSFRVLAGAALALALAAPAHAQDTGTYLSGPLDWGQSAGTAWTDFDADGKADYCRLDAGSRLLCTVSTGRGFGATHRSASAVDPGYPDGRMWGDVDGDKRADYCRRVGGGAVGPWLQCSRSTGTGFATDPASGPHDWGQLAGTALADVTGDGKADYCRVTGTSPAAASCAPSTGTGFGPTFNSGPLNGGADAGRAWIDFNGDRRADYCRVVDTNALACSLSTGTGFSSTLTSFPLDAGFDAGRAWADINGDGLGDYCRRVGGAGSTRMQCTLSTGTGYGATFTSGLLEWGADTGYDWVDFDGDGDRDFCRPVGQSATNTQLFCTLWTATGFGATVASGPLDWGYGGSRAWVDFNADGKADYCRLVGGGPDNMQVSCTTSTGTGFGPLVDPSPPPVTDTPPPGGGSVGPAGLPRSPGPRIVVTLAYDYSAGKRSTLLRRLSVKGVPRGATVTAICPKGCARKSYVKRNARGAISLKVLIGKRLKAGTTITIVVNQPGAVAAVKTLRIRAGRPPQVTTRCLPPGGTRPASCG